MLTKQTLLSVDSDLSGGFRYRPFEQPWRGLKKFVQFKSWQNIKKQFIVIRRC